MRHSAHYKEFEEEASGWEDKLNRVHVLFDRWVEVQRQWVYLEGVFTDNADIMTQLPKASGAFRNINNKFMTVMKAVYKQPFVLGVLNIPDVQATLEQMATSLQNT